MKGILHFLSWINENWTIIVAIITLVFSLYLKAKASFNKWIKMTDEEKQKDLEDQIKKAKQAIANYILSFVASAETEWEGNGLGPIKRAQVIEKIYKDYPILLEISDQREFMKFIDEHIDLALETVRETFQKEEEVKRDDL